MTGYNQAHGDTRAVRLDLTNDQEFYTEFMRCVGIAQWDGDEGRWRDIDKAAEELSVYVAFLQTTSAREGRNGEIMDADLQSVDYRELITLELYDRNLEAGRPGDTGL